MIYDLKFNIWFKRAVLALLLSTINHRPSTCFAQGSLTPSGAPAPTMKSLTQIEPRTPISSPTTVSSPGSYYLTTNLAVPAFGSAITIIAENVTLDLCGFTLFGNNSNSFGAIIIATNRATVINGFIKNCAFNYAVDASSFSGCRFENLTLSSNATGLRAGSQAIVRNCIATHNLGPGLVCQDSDYLTGNLCASNNNGGIYVLGTANRIENNQLFYNASFNIVGANVLATNNLVINNSFRGVLIGGAPPNWIIGPTVNATSITTNMHAFVNFDLN